MVPGRAGRGVDIVRVAADGALDTLVQTDADESYVVPSPDGRWLAFVSDQSGRYELYVRSLSGGDAQIQVSVDGATEPVWSRDGREVFYRRDHLRGADLVAAALDLTASPRVVSRTTLFDVSRFTTAQPHANYDVAPDGKSFVFVRRRGADEVVVLQHVGEMARRLARERRAR
jgi:serine/threonine-protein kinase